MATIPLMIAVEAKLLTISCYLVQVAGFKVNRLEGVDNLSTYGILYPEKKHHLTGPF